MTVLHPESFRNDTKPMESQTLIKVYGMCVCGNNGIELEYLEFLFHR